MIPKFPLGAFLWNPSATDTGSQAYFLNQLATFTNQMGAAPQFLDAFTDYYANWDQWVPIQNELIQGWSITPALKNTIPVMTIPMASNADFGNSDAVFKDIVAGKYDNVFTGLVTGWRDAGWTNIYARIGPEMNGAFEPWFMGSDPATVADFVLAFQHIANLVHNVPGMTVKTVWNPATINYTAQPTINSYPGDAYVDVIGADPYSTSYPVELYDWAKNDGTVDTTPQEWFSNPINRAHYWMNPNATQYNPNGYDPAQWGFKQVLALATAHNKPIGLAETGAGGDGTSTGPIDDPQFVKWLYDQLSAPGAPKTEFVNVWDINPSDGNWEFTNGSKPNELLAWQTYFGNPANVTPAPTVPVPPTIGTGPNTLTLNVAEDAYNGDAQFTVSVDGTQLGGTLTAQGIYSLSQSQNFVFQGTWDPTKTHTVVVTFVNDAQGSAASQNRNLYLNSDTIDGVTTQLNVEQNTNGAQSFAFGGTATNIAFVDSASSRYTAALTPGVSRPLTADITGLNNNIYEWTEGAVTAIGASSYNMVLTASLTDLSGNSFKLNNFNEADVTLSNGPTAAGTANTLEIDNAMRGAISLVSGNYKATVNVLSAYADQKNNTVRMAFGSGTDTLVLNGDSGRTYAVVTGGSGTATATLNNVLNSVINGGAGTLTVSMGNAAGTAIAGSGSLDVTGSGAADTFVYHAGNGLLTIENYTAAQGDLLEIDQTLQASMTQATTASGVMLSFGATGKGVLLKGLASFAPSQISWLAADGSVIKPVAAAPPASTSTTTTIGSGTDTLVLKLSEDAYQGNAQYTVSVDGSQVGGVQTSVALHSSGVSDTLNVLGSWAVGNHTVTVNFLNDAWGGSTTADRNLYIDSATYDGTAVAAVTQELGAGGPVSFNVSDTTPTVAPAGTTTTIGSGSDTLVLKLSEDAYQGDAQYTVSVDGHQIGGIQTSVALHSSGVSDTLNVLGSWAVGNHTVTVNFLNDVWGGSTTADRNLYIDSAAYDGTAVAAVAQELGAGGPVSFNVSDTTPTVASAGPTTTVGTGSDTLTLKISEDAYQGDAQFTVAVDGRQIGGTLSATSLHGSGATDTLNVQGDWAPGNHTATVSFLNDAWGGSATTDRNLYVEGATYDGSTVPGAALYLAQTGAMSFGFADSTAAPQAAGTSTTLGTGADKLVLKLSEDAYQGDAQFTVSVDGVPIGPTLTSTSLHSSGVSDTVTILGSFTPGAHTATVNFLNDAWGGTAALDRNLYIDSATMNGTAISGATQMLGQSGPVSFTFPGHA